MGTWDSEIIKFRTQARKIPFQRDALHFHVMNIKRALTGLPFLNNGSRNVRITEFLEF
jgi:hypothetical protein